MLSAKSYIKKVECSDVKGNTFEVSVDDLTFRPAVYGIIIRDGEILLSKQWDGYDFPGGGIELGESTKDALVREVKEETGLDVEMGVVVHCQDSFFKLPHKGNFVHSIHMYYECKVTGGELSTDYLDEQEKQYASMAEWVELKNIDDINIFSSADPKTVLSKYFK